MNDCERNHPDEALIDDCVQCGAPVCCKWCCDIDTLGAQVAELKADKERLLVLYKLSSNALNDIADKVGYLK